MSHLFLINILISLLWCGVTGSFAFLNLLFGFLIGSLGLWVIREQMGSGAYFDKGSAILRLALHFIKELGLSVWRVALLAISPRQNYHPGIIAFPLSLKSDQEITLLANLITLTPGTLSIDVSEDKKELFIHCIDVRDPNAIIDDIKQGFERQVRNVYK